MATFNYLPSISSVTAGESAVDCLGRTGLDYTVEPRPLYLGSYQSAWGEDGGVEVPQPGDTLAPQHRALVREDNDEVFGVVGNQYEVVQNRDLAKLVDAARKERPEIKLVAAGPIDGGRRASWWLKTGTFTLPGNDVSDTAVCLYTGHDGGSSVQLVPWSTRLVCRNSLEFGRSFKLRHTSNIMDRLPQMLDILAKSEAMADQYARQAQRMSERRMNQDEVRKFFLAAYEQIHNVRIPLPTEQSERDKKARDRAMDVVSRWLVNLQDERQSLQGNGNTAWTCLNSVTQWANHERTVRRTRDGETLAEARTSSMMDGAAGKACKIAFKLATELV